MRWSLEFEPGSNTLESYTLGRLMVTPSDITIANPSADDVPYSGSLLFNNSFVSERDRRADYIGATIGLVGPSSGADSMQKWFH